MRRAMIFLAVFGLAAAALAQAPDSIQSNAPTSRSFRMKVLEPAEGATIQGTEFNIVLGNPPATPPGTAVVPKERQDSLTPTYQVWIDGKDFGKIPIGQNVLRVTGVSTGPHKIVIAAKNTAGELIDRKEIGVTTTMVVAEVRESAAAPAPAYVPPPAPEPAPAPAPSYTTESPTLPKTATSYPLAALAGAALVAAGALLRRRIG